MIILHYGTFHCGWSDGFCRLFTKRGSVHYSKKTIRKKIESLWTIEIHYYNYLDLILQHKIAKIKIRSALSLSSESLAT